MIDDAVVCIVAHAAAAKRMNGEGAPGRKGTAHHRGGVLGHQTPEGIGNVLAAVEAARPILLREQLVRRAQRWIVADRGPVDDDVRLVERVKGTLGISWPAQPKRPARPV